jgi:hypothetical protein
MTETSVRCVSRNHRPDALLVTAASAALVTLLPAAAHQLGCLTHLPDPPGEFFASDRITESKAAHPLGIPDGLLGHSQRCVSSSPLNWWATVQLPPSMLFVRLLRSGNYALGVPEQSCVRLSWQ